MKIKWLVQDIGKTSMLQDNFGTLQKIGSAYQGFGLVQGESIMSGCENILTDLDEIYIIRGGTKIIDGVMNCTNLNDLCENLNGFQKANSDLFLSKLKAGFFYDERNFDQAYYNSLDLPLLNKDAFFLPIKENKDTFFDCFYFLKPSKDLKTFIPGILQPGETIQHFIENSQHLKNYDHELALLSPVKNIKKEYRFFVIDKKVVTGSQYKNGEHVEYSSAIPKKINDIASDYAQLYQPHDIFTMDLAETENDVKIVEYNCWNGSGLYHSDKVLLFRSVEEFISGLRNRHTQRIKY